MQCPSVCCRADSSHGRPKRLRNLSKRSQYILHRFLHIIIIIIIVMTIYVTAWADGARHYVNMIMWTYSTLLVFVLKQTYFTLYRNVFDYVALCRRYLVIRLMKHHHIIFWYFICLVHYFVNCRVREKRLEQGKIIFHLRPPNSYYDSKNKINCANLIVELQ